jgi:hypothetical protein
VKHNSTKVNAMKSYISSRVALVISALFTVSGVMLLAFATPGIVSGNTNQQIEPFTDFACLECHTDQQRLTELAPAEQEEEAESLSSGPG